VGKSQGPREGADYGVPTAFLMNEKMVGTARRARLCPPYDFATNFF
jgi:hypothetical protein